VTGSSKPSGAPFLSKARLREMIPSMVKKLTPLWKKERPVYWATTEAIRVNTGRV